MIAREMVVDIEHPTLGPMRALGSAIKMSATPPDVRRRAPLLGEQPKDVLLETGFSEEEIGTLIEDGVVGTTARE